MNILGALVFTSALFWHVPFINDYLKLKTKQYVALNKEVTSSNKVKSNLILKLESDPNNLSIATDLFNAQKEYQIKYDNALSLYKHIKKVRKDSKVFLFPNMEKFLYTLGISIFLIYSSVCFILFYRNRMSTSNLYLLSVKIKISIIAFFAVAFSVYTFYPKLDFEGTTYLISGIIIAIFSITSAFLISKHISTLQKDLEFEKRNLVSLIKLLSRIKINYTFPFAKMAMSNPKEKESKKEKIREELQKLDVEVEETLKTIA
ncbi:hypothetical protein HN014_07960 [Aquimarina sp. TRL1]|uniref:hypothetical protein n=1 Tax=Aquimarina sp. (strain TRL1) TaxID=2736252 RepID=UPI00158E62B6|nr:hypothetical protein [Aquimarina sp. TRL1]QKX04852.1 hypothetical protein HN014_07960 [Aquimarina sp. TRL1]